MAGQSSQRVLAPNICVWCGYDTGVEAATQCAECGADLGDRERLNQLLETKSNLLAICYLMTFVCFGMTFALFNTQKDDVFWFGVFGALAIGAVVACLFATARVWRDLGQEGRPHPQRRSVLLYLLAFAGQLTLLGLFQLAATLALWQI